jgi:hypothetical protein
MELKLDDILKAKELLNSNELDIMSIARRNDIIVVRSPYVKQLVLVVPDTFDFNLKETKTK